MAIKYALRENSLNRTPMTYVARVRANGTTDFEGLADTIIRQGSTVTKADIMAVFENIKTAVESHLMNGFNVNLEGLVQMHASVQGVFSNIEDGFDSSKHHLSVKARVSPVLQGRIGRNAKAIKLESKKPSPSLLSYHDTASGEINGKATPGNIGSIIGHRLKFDLQSHDEGIFLISTDINEEIKITSIQRNKPKELVFLMPPELPAGIYHLEVRVLYGEDEIRTGRLEASITVG